MLLLIFTPKQWHRPFRSNRETSEYARMANHLDIFKMNDTGRVRWLESVNDIEDAKTRLAALGMATPGNYIVFDQTGYGLIFEIDLNGRLLEIDEDRGL